MKIHSACLGVIHVDRERGTERDMLKIREILPTFICERNKNLLDVGDGHRMLQREW